MEDEFEEITREMIGKTIKDVFLNDMRVKIEFENGQIAEFEVRGQGEVWLNASITE